MNDEKNRSDINKMPKKKLNKDSIKILSRLLIYIMKSNKVKSIGIVIFIFISSVANVAGTIFIKNVIDKYIVPYLNTEVVDYRPLLDAIIVMAIIYLCGVLSTFLYNRIMVYITQGTLKSFRDDMFAHMEKLPIKFFDTNSHGEIMSLYTNDVDTLRQMISQSIPQLISSVITIVTVLVSMIILNIPLTIIALAMVVVMFVIAKKIGGLSGVNFRKQQKSIGTLNGYIEEMMEGQKVVKVFCYEEEAKEKFNVLNEELFESANHANKYANIMMPIMGNIGYISYVLAAMVGAVLAIYGINGFTIGGLAAFLQLTRMFNQPVSQISQQFNSIVMALAGAERVFSLLDVTPECDEGYVRLVNAKEDAAGNLTEVKERTGIWAWKHPHSDGTLSYTKLLGDVLFDKVDFGYTPEKIVLHDIEVFARPGEKVAFVGATGAGKTTITNLINRFYDIHDGKIRYDGINIDKIKKDDLRRSLGIVLQDTHLFTGTVADNIRYGKLDATDEEVFAAAKLANADQFIKHLPQGYKTMLTGDGANLSQGQRQLLSIARAAIANPPVLILDEATSSIDTRTEALVQEGMDKLMEGRTVFVIAHRLSTIQNSDVIMVLEQGRIIERGNHEALVKQKGRYYELYTGGLELE
ncbi:MAG TPA: ABC transporter ATP-binding protein [Lachnospiraceae bacterium]|nr:ABC transporter ATP-binding protein [Lachnospiraceae bacterium]